MSQDDLSQQIHAAVRWMAARCDGAITRDNVGFNQADSHLGRRLAAQPSLSTVEQAQALTLLTPYKDTQLPQGGFDHMRMLLAFAAAHRDTVTPNASGEEPGVLDGKRRSQVRAVERDGDVFLFHFPFEGSEPVRRAIKTIPGWRFNPPEHPKKWTVPLSQAGQVKDLADQHGFSLVGFTSTDLTAQPVVEAPRVTRVEVNQPVYDRFIDVADGEFVIRAGEDGWRLAAELRALPGRRYDRPAQTNLVPVSSAANVREFAREHKFMASAAAAELFAAAPSMQDLVRHSRRVDAETTRLGRKRFLVSYERSDPQFGELLDAIRLVPNDHFDYTRQAHEIPAAQCLEVERYAKRFDFEVSAAAQAIIDEYRAAAQAEADRITRLIAASKAKEPTPGFRASFPFPIRSAEFNPEETGMFPFQVAAVEYLLDHAEGRSFDGSEVGTGKTPVALAALELHHRRTGGGYPALIVCPRSLRLNWLREIRDWHAQWGVERTVHMAGNRPPQGGLFRPDITIVRRDMLASSVMLFVEPFKAMINDESHELKEKRSKRTEMSLAIASMVDGAHPLLLNLSGTPMVNGRARELKPQLQILRRLEDFGGNHAFDKRWCGKDVTSEDLNELGVELRMRCLRRVKKRDVMEQLPPLTITRVEVDIDNWSEYRRAEAAFLAWLREKEGPEAAMRAARAEMLVKMNHLRQLVGIGKLPDVVEWTRNNILGGDKMLLFAHHKPVQSALLEAVSEFNPRVIEAGQSDEERDRQVQEFQEDERVLVMVASIESGGQGLTMTASSNPAVVEMPWTPKSFHQAIGRSDRINQRDPVTGWPMVVPGTIDDYMEEILEEKGLANSAALDLEAGAESEEAAIDSVMVQVAKRMLENDR